MRLMPLAPLALLPFAACGGDKKVVEPIKNEGGEKAPATHDPDAERKKVEAIENVRKIYEGARAYYLDESSSRGLATPLPKQFPDSAPMTPGLGTCCASADHRCAPNYDPWDHPSWAAIKFSMADPHYYSYEYIAAGSERAATFTARAVGDLDCDGVYSTFEMHGHLDAEWNVTGSSVGVITTDELE